ncbi:MAG: hypothetical protein NT029_22040 [Armatimonadetes bacterium]|nr:hypothetical protein [Armatimonadota bacterium]
MPTAATWSHPIGVWFGAIGTLALFSLIYRENRVYRLFEHIFIGLAAGYLIKTTWTEVLGPQWFTPLFHDGQWPWALVAGFGLLFYTIFSRKHSWMSRIAIGALMGFAAGQAFQTTASDYIPQIRKSFKPLFVTPDQIPLGSGLTTLGIGLNNLLFVFIMVTVLTYFFFSFEQKNKVVAASARTGRLMLMFAFGAIFGSTVMARMALLIDRVWFLMHNWLHLQ